jgi:hypothetical protein
MVEHGDAMTGKEVTEPVALARDGGLGDAEKELRHAIGQCRRPYRRQRGNRLHQGFGGRTGLRHCDETCRHERHARQELRIGVAIEIVHEVQARAVAQQPDPRHRVAGKLRQRLSAEARPAGAEKHDVGCALREAPRGIGNCRDIIGAFGEPQ